MSSVTLKDGRIMEISPLGDKPEFLERAASLMFEEWREFWTNLGHPTASAVADWLRTIKGPDTLPYYVIGHIGDDLVGFAGVDANERDDDTRGPWLIDVLVVHKYRGNGAFKPLVQHIMDTQRKRGVSLMYLWTKPHQTVLYSQLGWEYLQDELWHVEGKGPLPMPVMTYDFTKMSPKL